MLHAREEVRRAQKSLEEKQRQEEDQLFMKFRNDRQLVEKKIEEEVTGEWEKKLQQLTAKYEDDLRSKKKDKNLERVNPSRMSISLSRNFSLGINRSFYQRKSRIGTEYDFKTR